MELQIVSAILFIASAIFFWNFRQSLSKYQEILLTPTSKISDIKERYRAVFDSLGPGHFNEYVEVKGKMICEERLISQVSILEVTFASALSCMATLRNNNGRGSSKYMKMATKCRKMIKMYCAKNCPNAVARKSLSLLCLVPLFSL